VVGETGQVHLLSVWDEGIPPEIPHDNLYTLKWNPANLLAEIAAIPGLKAARRVGTDSYGPASSTSSPRSPRTPSSSTQGRR
jgi:hypothetical protein